MKLLVPEVKDNLLYNFKKLITGYSSHQLPLPLATPPTSYPSH